jgi:hypothetical protein
MWTNGVERFCYRRVVKAGKVATEDVPDLPEFGRGDEDADRPRFDQLKPATSDALLFAFRRCHNYIAGSEMGTELLFSGRSPSPLPIVVWNKAESYHSEELLEPKTENRSSVPISPLLWPFVLAVAGITMVVAIIRARRFSSRLVAPFAVVAAIHGALLSQGTWGSTYGIWPLLFILVGWTLTQWRLPEVTRVLIVLIAAASTLNSAWDYVDENRRLIYAKVDDGDVVHSRLPALRGLAVTGKWLPQFKELVAFAEQHIPVGEAILSLPGEDLFYFTTGRVPAFPNIMFDRTINPYSPATINRLVDSRRVQWVIVKEILQINGEPMPELPMTLRLLQSRFGVVAHLTNYDIYRRKGRVSQDATLQRN